MRQIHRPGSSSPYHCRFVATQHTGTNQLQNQHEHKCDIGDHQQWRMMTDSTEVRTTRASSGAGKKGSLKNPKIMREGIVAEV